MTSFDFKRLQQTIVTFLADLRGMQLKKKKGKRLIININVNLLYSENNLWSHRYKAWKRYDVLKARLPNQFYTDNRIVDNPDNCPKTFGTFVGKHNSGIITALKDLLDKFEKIKSFPDVLTIHGPSGTGKSALGKVFLNELIDIQKYKNSQIEKWCLVLDAKAFRKDLQTLWSRVTTFAEPPLDKFIMTKYRLLMIDNFDSIPPSSQQILKRIMEAYSGTLKYLFICPDPKSCMTGFVLAKSTNIRTRVISERDALQVILMICNQHKIGYEREGIHAVFKTHPNRSVSKMLDLIQEVFLKEFFISRENVMKVTIGKSGDVSDLPIISQYRAVEPLERCRLCTLLPPCQHMTMDELLQRGIARRKELPRYKTGSMSCPEFVRYGYCSMFNKNGHCSLDHPKNLHVVKKFAVRCPQCSIVWPCNHCDFTKYRVSMQALIDELHARMGRIRAINVPEPAISLTRHLEHIPTWKDQLRHIGRKYTTAEYSLLIAAATEWLETGYCTRKDEYKKREKNLREAFGELYTTHILEDPLVAQQRMQQRELVHSAGGTVITGAGKTGANPMDAFGSHVIGGVIMRPKSRASRSPSISPVQSRTSSPAQKMRR